MLSYYISLNYLVKIQKGTLIPRKLWKERGRGKQEKLLGAKTLSFLMCGSRLNFLYITMVEEEGLLEGGRKCAMNKCCYIVIKSQNKIHCLV